MMDTMAGGRALPPAGRAVVLQALPPGMTGLVTELRASGPIRRRLLDLGFVPGTTVTAVRRSPLGDPTAYYVRGATFALRREDAAHIVVTPVRAG